MTSPDPMTREDLLDLAALDAYGLLDDYEAALYTRSFHHAPVTVQREIVELQADMAGDTSLLTDEMPPVQLRQRVLSAVSTAIEMENSKLEPIASIGRRTHPSTMNGQEARSVLQAVSRFFFGGTGHFWRAACFALIGALVVMFYFYSVSVKRNDQITALAIDQHTLLTLSQELPTIENFLADPGTHSRALSEVLPDPARPEDQRGPWARLWINPEGHEAFLAVDLPSSNKDEVYSLEVRHEDGTSRVLATFAGKGRVSGMLVSMAGVDMTTLATATFSVTGPTGVVLRSA